MNNFNDIGVSRQLDWPRIRKLLTIGLCASLMHLAGDLMLGWGVEDENLTGLARMLSAYTGTSDGGIFAAALLGMLGMALEGLSFFGVYRLMAEQSPAHAHCLRSGIFGYVIFGGCGFHVPVCALTFLRRHGVDSALLLRCAGYFLLPSLALFWIFLFVLIFAQIRAFARGLTPYPKSCWVFSPLVGALAARIPAVLWNAPFANALACAWLAVGCAWTFGGLLAAMKRARNA